MIDKRPALIVRCATTADVVRAVNFARDNGLAARRPRRRAQHRRQRHVRRRHRDRPLADEGRERRPGRAPRHHRGRRHARGPRRRHPGPRPRHAGRHQLHHRHRRPDARRRLRLAEPQVRHDHRQPRVRRGRDRGRRGGARQRHRAPRSLLGAPGRQRQFRRRHPLRVPAPSRRPGGAERPDRLPVRPRRSRCCGSTANSRRRRRTSSPCGPSCARRRRCRSSRAEVHGKEIIALALLLRGRSGRRARRSSRRCASSARLLGEHVGVQPYTAWQQAFDPLLTPGARNYWKSHNFSTLDDRLFDAVIEYIGKLPSPQCEIFFGALGGATARPAPDATAYAHRDAQFVMNVHGRWDDAADDERGIRLGARLLRCLGALRERRRLRQFPDRRRGRSRAQRLRPELRAPRRR